MERSKANSVEAAFPYLARFIKKRYGWIEIGDDEMNPSFVRAFDGGGTIWESEAPYTTLDDALRALDTALARWMREVLREP